MELWRKKILIKYFWFYSSFQSCNDNRILALLVVRQCVAIEIPHLLYIFLKNIYIFKLVMR